MQGVSDKCMDGDGAEFGDACSRMRNTGSIDLSKHTACICVRQGQGLPWVGCATE